MENQIIRRDEYRNMNIKQEPAQIKMEPVVYESFAPPESEFRLDVLENMKQEVPFEIDSEHIQTQEPEPTDSIADNDDELSESINNGNGRLELINGKVRLVRRINKDIYANEKRLLNKRQEDFIKTFSNLTPEQYDVLIRQPIEQGLIGTVDPPFNVTETVPINVPTIPATRIIRSSFNGQTTIKKVSIDANGTYTVEKVEKKASGPPPLAPPPVNIKPAPITTETRQVIRKIVPAKGQPVGQLPTRLQTLPGNPIIERVSDERLGENRVTNYVVRVPNNKTYRTMPAAVKEIQKPELNKATVRNVQYDEFMLKRTPAEMKILNQREERFIREFSTKRQPAIKLIKTTKVNNSTFGTPQVVERFVKEVSSNQPPPTIKITLPPKVNNSTLVVPQFVSKPTIHGTIRNVKRNPNQQPIIVLSDSD